MLTKFNPKTKILQLQNLRSQIIKQTQNFKLTIHTTQIPHFGTYGIDRIPFRHSTLLKTMKPTLRKI